MAATIKATFDTRKLDRYLTDLQKKKLPRIESQALNRTTTTVRTDTARKIRAEKSIKAKGVSPRFNSEGGGLVITKRARPNSLFAQISGNRNTTPMSKTFFSVGERKGSARKPPSVSVRMSGRRFVINNAQLNQAMQIRARGKYSGNSFKFVDDFEQDAPLVRLKTFSIRSQLSENYITKPLDSFAFATFDKEFKRLLKRNSII